MEYFKVVTMQSKVAFDDAIEAEFYIILEDEYVAESKSMSLYYKHVNQCNQVRTVSGDASPLVLTYRFFLYCMLSGFLQPEEF